MKKVAVVGTGYVGCVTAACLSRDGHQVIGVDVDADKVAALNAGATPVAERGLDELVNEQVAAGRLSASVDLGETVRQTEIALIAVGTPSGNDGAVSTEAVENVIRQIGEALRGTQQSYTVVVRSTLLPGILEDRLAAQLAAAAERPLGPDLRLCNNPEFLREGSAIRDYDEPPYVLVGTFDEGGGEDVLSLYEKIDAEKIVTDSRTAALVKYACNAFHAVKIAFANELGSLAKTFGAEGQRVMELVCRDTKLNISPAYLRPGFAFGGSCLPKDVRALARYAEQHAVQLGLIRSILPSNQQHLDRAIAQVQATGTREIGMVGLSFKAGTDDLRESPFVTLVETLLGRGYQIKIYDPGISLNRLTGRNLAYVDRHLPHLAALLVEDPAELFNHASLLLLGSDVANELEIPKTFKGQVIDLRRSLVSAKG